MNREIKYRGKRLDNGQWLEGSLIRRGERYFIMPFDWSLDMADCQVDPDTVGEYAGHKDKNGKGVYEDDVLSDQYGSIGIVEWQDGGFVVNFGDVDIFPISDCFDDSYQTWVVGNVLDNPELLK